MTHKLANSTTHKCLKSVPKLVSEEGDNAFQVVFHVLDVRCVRDVELGRFNHETVKLVDSAFQGNDPFLQAFILGLQAFNGLIALARLDASARDKGAQYEYDVTHSTI